MSFPAPSRLLLQSLQIRPQPGTHHLVPLCQQRRSIFGLGRRSRKTEVLDAQKVEDFTKEAATTQRTAVPKLNSGKLSQNIFDTVPETTQTEQDQRIKGVARVRERRDDSGELDDGPQAPIKLEDLKPTFRNPRPAALVRWERKMAIRDVRGRHRLNKTEKILRTERFHSARSPFVKSSVKKLGALARQIAGKPIEEAMIQMRFSRRKAAQDVLKHLKYARDQAVIRKEMGLGIGIGEGVSKPPPQGLEAELEKKGKILVEDRDGKKRVVKDRSAIYVDEAWVGRGKFSDSMEYRAKGRSNRIRSPFTSISVVLKEEATRIRLQEEREQKRQKKPVWVQLPDRPITAQRQYPLW